MGLLAVLSTTLASTLTFAAEGDRHAHFSNAKMNAYALAEAGVNNAVAVLSAGYALGTVQYPGDPSLLQTPRTTEFPDGSVTWSGVLQQVSGRAWAWQWTITSRSSVANPTGPTTAPVASTVNAIVPVVLPLTQQVGSNTVLNWIFAFRDATFEQQLSIGSPIYAGGNLTLSNKAAVLGSAGKVAVGGVLTMTQVHDGVGCDTTPTCGSSTRIGEAHLVGGCKYKNNGLHGPLSNPAGCWWDADNVWVDPAHRDAFIPADLIVLPTLTCCAPVAGGIAPPAAAGAASSMGFWYVNASPGPNAPCDPATRTGTPPTFDTGDNTINNSATPTMAFNLTPYNQSYTCKTVGGGSVIGELSWNASTMVLAVKGTVFIDGSAAIDKVGYQGTPAFTYTGTGTIYLSGTFAVKSSIMCAVVASGDCNRADGAWHPDENALIVVADGDGGGGGAQSQGNVVSAGVGAEIVSSSFQGGLVANKNIQINTSSKHQGPLVSVYNSVTSGQSGTLTFPTTNFPPVGGAGVTQPVPAGTLLPAVEFS